MSSGIQAKAAEKSSIINTQRTLHIVVNPVSGHKLAVDFVDSEVIPLLQKHSVAHVVHTTTGVQDAGRIGRELVQAGARCVAIAGGDGTLHELIEGVSDAPAPMQFVIFPLGTANALYSSFYPEADLSTPEGRLCSFKAFLEGKDPKPLPVTTTSIGDSSAIHTHVVASFALHAAILKDSEALRAEHPGVERFKMAAEKNASVFFEADVKLLPSADGVLRYDPATQLFKQADTAELSGPFAYFLSTATTARLEPTFVIAPLLERVLPISPSMDIVIIRPMRDQAVAELTPEERGAKWAARAWEVLGSAYNKGSHVDLTYPAEGETLGRGQGEAVVEYFRCGGFEWVPKSSPAHTFCADGALHQIPASGKAVAMLNDSDFAVWA